MTSSRRLQILLLGLVLATGCSPTASQQDGSVGGDIGQPSIANLPNGDSLPPLAGVNIMALTIDGSLCSNSSYTNKPCVSVTICSPGTTTCQTINDILLDTGSFGLRLFKQVVTVPLTQVNAPSGNPLAECVGYGDGSSDWGPVKLASVVLAGEPAVQVPVQIIDSSFGTVPGSCGTPEPSPAKAGFNGILGLGLLAQDCGTTCATSTNTNYYFSCAGATCTSTLVGLANQVTNPVSALPKDNNGVIVELPRIRLGGAKSLSGYVVLGIGTRANNAPPSSGIAAYTADPTYAEFATTFDGQTYGSFLDSGSNAFYFPAPSSGALPDCSTIQSNLAGWYCPSSTQALSATTISNSGVPSASILFQVGSLVQLPSSNSVFLELGGVSSGLFDWGLPFFIGRNIYVGIEGKSSSLGTGPYWAY